MIPSSEPPDVVSQMAEEQLQAQLLEEKERHAHAGKKMND